MERGGECGSFALMSEPWWWWPTKWSCLLRSYWCCTLQSLGAAMLFTSDADTDLLVGWEDSYGAAEI